MTSVCYGLRNMFKNVCFATKYCNIVSLLSVVFLLYFKINKKIILVKQIFWSYMHLSISLYNMMIEIQFLIQINS